MSDSPGVIFTLKFTCEWKTGGYDYLEYMDRPEAFKLENHKQDEYKDFLDYMGNEEKSDGLFDMTNDRLTSENKNHYRALEKESQKQGCPKYIGITSFDNDFLREHGILTPMGLNTQVLKEIARSSISELIHTSEKLKDENVYWNAAIHTNTDNVHIHYSLLEKTRIPRKYDKLEIEAFDSLKSKVANNIIGSEKIIELSRLTRECLLPDFKRELFCSQKDLLILAKVLPQDTSKWQYNRDKFEPYRGQVNRCVNNIIKSKSTLGEKFENYNTELDNYTDKLKGIYGVGNRELYKNFKPNKLEDFYSRAGNTLLKYIKENKIQELVETSHDAFEDLKEELSILKENEIRKLDLFEREIVDDEKFTSTEFQENYDESFLGLLDNEPIEDSNYSEEYQDDYDENILSSFYGEPNENINFTESFQDEVEESIIDLHEYKEISFYVDWTKEYKQAREYLYGSKKVEQDYDEAFELLSQESQKGNALATFDIGKMYLQGALGEIEINKSQEYFSTALQGFLFSEGNSNSVKSKEYISYRIGRMFNLGYGTEQNYEKAYEWYMKANTNKYAQYSLGNLFYYGNGVEQNYEASADYYLKSANQGNAYAQYEIGKMLDKGQGIAQDQITANTYFSKAFSAFEISELDNPDDNLRYRLGQMCLKGIGTEIDIERAKIYFTKSAKQGNAHAQYALAKMSLENKNISEEEFNNALSWLTKSANSDNSLAQYALGKIHLKGNDFILSDIPKAIEWFTKSSELGNEYAQYSLGKLYYTDEKYKDIPQAIECFTKSAEQGNEYAQYSLGKLYYTDEKYKEIPQAIEWFTKAGEQGNEYAQYALGKHYYSDNQYKDTSKAIDWFTKSAEQDNQYAQYSLGKIYFKDKAYMNIPKAIEWFTRSAELGNENAKKYLQFTAEKKQRYIPPKSIEDYTQSTKHLTYALASSLKQSISAYERHLDELQREFDYEQNMQISRGY